MLRLGGGGITHVIPRRKTGKRPDEITQEVRQLSAHTATPAGHRCGRAGPAQSQMWVPRQVGMTTWTCVHVGISPVYSQSCQKAAQMT